MKYSKRHFISAVFLVLFMVVSSAVCYAGEVEDDLIIAVRDGRIQWVKDLIKQGADVNAKDDLGWTALIMAVEKNNIEIAKLLIEKGADVNAEDKEGWTALDYATKWGQPLIIKLLKRSGAKEY